MPYMSVTVSDLAEIYHLICSRMVFVCFIAVLHWQFIIIQGSANNPRYFFSLVIPNLFPWLTAAILIYGDLALCPIKICHPSSRPSSSFSVMLSRLPTSCHQHVCWTLVKLLNKTDPKTDELCYSFLSTLTFRLSKRLILFILCLLTFKINIFTLYISFPYLLECKLTFQICSIGRNNF